jgi:hypothetical protein
VPHVGFYVLYAWKAGGVISLSVVRMFRQMFGAIKYAAREEGFVAILGAAILLVITGTVAYSLAEGWNVVDGFYFAVATLTTSSIADPDLTLTNEAIKIFTAFYVLTGIGILVEVARQIGFGYVAMRADHHADRQHRRHKDDPPEPPSAD